MARITFKDVKKGMTFKASGVGREGDERIFRVTRKVNSWKDTSATASGYIKKGKTVWLSTPAAFDKKAQWHGMLELPFTMVQLNKLLTKISDGTLGWFVNGSKHEHLKPCPITEKPIPGELIFTVKKRGGTLNACGACATPSYPS